MTSVCLLNPLTDPRWGDLLARHPHASIFHSRGWLEALARTYGYEPFALTATAEGPLNDGIAVCRIGSWMCRRLVSLPFSDHCDPLVDRPDALAAMLAFLRRETDARPWCSLELRPRHCALGGLPRRASYCLHTLDLARPAHEIFEGFNPSNTQRAIRRAERECLVYETGNSDQMLAHFYPLLRLTRRRHGMPPQPFAWFRNLRDSLRGALAIHLASKDGRPVAGLLTLTFKKTIVYKYGGSDAAYHRLGSMPFLFWRAIQAAREQGIEEMDLGRSDPDQPGLITFKDHLGARRSSLTYYVLPERDGRTMHDGRISRAARRVMRHLPDGVLDLTGRVLYRHLG